MKKAINHLQPYCGIPQLRWDIDCLSRKPGIRDYLSKKASSRAYPTRLLRYWFIYHFLRVERERRSQPLRVCEVGIDVGQMLRFTSSAGDPRKPIWSSWDGVDYRLQTDRIADAGYTSLTQSDVEQSLDWLSADHDVIIFLHVLEHLRDPEKLFRDMTPRLKPGAVIVGGFPSVPHFCISRRERQLREHTNDNGHITAFSVKRTRTIAAACRLQLDFITGAFLLRASGLSLENYSWWFRFNLAFGSFVPGWPGELYWVMRKSGEESAII